MKKLLILNLGSTTFKFKLYEMGAEENMLATGNVESIGASGKYKVEACGGKLTGSCACATHLDALELAMDLMTRLGLTIDVAGLDAIGYKAVHGGTISGSHIVNDALIAEMERMVPFAPAHNPVYLAMMKQIRAQYPDTVQIACFETAFHATIPQERVLYGVPYDWAEKYGVRRWGFHGSSHSYIAWKMGQIAPDARRLISVHLGGSCSMCAIQDGKSIATTMGATPQSGLFHNNRVGDFDVFCLPVLVQELGSLDAALKALSTQSGLLGLSGASNDIRGVEEAEAAGSKQAILAVDAFVDNVAGYVGMFTAYLGGLDAIVFTGGIGTNDDEIRGKIVNRLGFVNAKLDPEKNVPRGTGLLSTPDSGVQLWALETNEEVMVARGCMKCLK